ncbi:MAG: hypothetical protein WBW16_08930 [Bacteroidota bacterium]
MIYRFKFLAIFLPLLLVQAVFTQPFQRQGPGPPGMPGERMRRIEQFKKVRLMEVLQLDDQESVRFFNRYGKFEEEVRGLERERNAIIDDLDSLVKQDEKPEAYQKDFDDLIALGQKVADARARFYKDVQGVLTPQQAAKLVVFERDFGRELREMIQDVQRERRRGPGPR